MKIDNKRPIIYISGWMGDGKNSGTYRWLEKHFTNLDAYATGGCTDIEKMKNDLHNIIAKCKVSPILLANSYGSFLASLFGEPTILVNPAIYPSEVLPRLTELTQEEIDNFAKCEWGRDMTNDWWDRQAFYSVLSTEDEIVPDHKINKISAHDPVYVPGGKHQLTNEQRTEYLLPLIIKVLEKYPIKQVRIIIIIPKNLYYLINKYFGIMISLTQYINESFIVESFKNYIGLDDIKKVGEEVVEILNKSYEPIGGWGGNSVEDLLKEADLWLVKTWEKGGEIKVVAVYKSKDNGKTRKLAAMGTDGSDEGKKYLKKIAEEDISQFKRGCYAEVSGAMEHIFNKYANAIPVPNVVVGAVLNKDIISLSDDGFHYTRKINGTEHEKILVMTANNEEREKLIEYLKKLKK